MTVKSLILTGAAVTVLVVLGAISAGSPEFKAHATTAAIIVLGVLSLSGVLFALIARLLPARPETDPQAASALRAGSYTGSTR